MGVNIVGVGFSIVVLCVSCHKSFAPSGGVEILRCDDSVCCYVDGKITVGARMFYRRLCVCVRRISTGIQSCGNGDYINTTVVVVKDMFYLREE